MRADRDMAGFQALVGAVDDADDVVRQLSANDGVLDVDVEGQDEQRKLSFRFSEVSRLPEKGEVDVVALPFAALYLADRTELSAAGIGAVVGGIPMIAAFGGLLSGMVADRFGAVRLMRLGLLLNVVVYGALAFATAPAAIVVLFLSLGLARTMVEPSMKKLLSLADTGDGRIFRVRYITLCMGAIVGPAVGGVLYHASPAAFFLAPAGFFALYLAVVLVRGGELSRLETVSTATSSVPWTSALRDPLLMAAIAVPAVELNALRWASRVDEGEVLRKSFQLVAGLMLFVVVAYAQRSEIGLPCHLVVLEDLAEPVTPRVLIRGNKATPGEEVQP